MSADLSIVVVEDNELLREEMVSFLTRPGWLAHGVDCGEELSLWLVSHTPGIAVIDVNLPYEDGYSIAERLRRSYPSLGIVMLTARVLHSERSAGYQAGADVYLTKPTSTAELIAVIENLGRRLLREEQQEMPRDLTGLFLLDRNGPALVSPQGERCLLTLGEQRLLELLALAPDRTADIFYLLHAVSRSADRLTTKEALAAKISRLRSKCRLMLGLENLVVADRGIGYRLTVVIRVQAL